MHNSIASGVSMVMGNTPENSAISSKVNLHAAPSQTPNASVEKGSRTIGFMPDRLWGTHHFLDLTLCQAV